MIFVIPLITIGALLDEDIFHAKTVFQISNSQVSKIRSDRLKRKKVLPQ